MGRDFSARVHLLELPHGPGNQQYLRLALCGRQPDEAMPGQYCLLGRHTESWPCSYVSLPGVAGRFLVTTHASTRLGKVGDLLDYSGPLGSAWPLPLQSARLLAISRGEGLLPLLGALDEIRCWLPGVQIRLSHEGISAHRLPEDCQAWVSTLLPQLRDSSSGWLHLRQLLDAFLPDTVYCCAAPQVARQAARLCWQKGVAAQRIWLRTDHLPGPAWAASSGQGWPVQRYDRLLATLKWIPPGG